MYSHQLDAFLKAAELGSLGRAAQALYISTPAMIQQINLLEQKCGARLFVRSHQGVTLTPAGKVFYEDARTIVRLSRDALERVRQMEERARSTVRIGTSLLFKCRMFPDLWSRISPLCPQLKVEILPLQEQERQDGLFSGLGLEYDIVEGVYGSTAYRGLCAFQELMRTPICCAVSRGHPLAGADSLTLEALDGACLVMPVAGVSEELDAFRREIALRCPRARVLDSSYYGVDTFALCEVKPYVLITQQVYRDIHPDLVTIPLDSPYTMPYGLMYSRDPSPGVSLFMEAVREHAPGQHSAP